MGDEQDTRPANPLFDKLWEEINEQINDVIDEAVDPLQAEIESLKQRVADLERRLKKT
jgi:polyhydroxyalkanoate synthesis regulator phasin